MSLEHRSGTPFGHIPSTRQIEYDRWLRTMSQLFPNAEAEIHTALNGYIDGWLQEHQAVPHAAFCSSWIPGPDWSQEGIYQPIYLTMMNLYNDHSLAHS
jgi:hypothetical protein